MISRKKKGFHRNSNGFSGRNKVISQKKKGLQASHAEAEANRLPEAHRPRVIVPPCLPSRRPWMCFPGAMTRRWALQSRSLHARFSTASRSKDLKD